MLRRLLWRVLRHWGGSVAPPLPTLPYAGYGWYASDYGLVPASRAPHCLYPQEQRRVWLDFGDLTELATDTIVSATVSASSGLRVSTPDVDGVRVYVTVLKNLNTLAYETITITITTSSDAVIVRTGTLANSLPNLTTQAVLDTPAGLTPSVGWYVDDDAFLKGLQVGLRMFPGEVRRFWLDYVNVSELVAGDTLDATSVTLASLPAVVLSAASVSGSRVYFTASAFAAATEPVVQVRLATTGGAVLTRSVFFTVADLAPTYPTEGSTVSLTPSIGWYASDEALLPAFGQAVRLGPTEKRRVWMDFVNVTELATDTIASAVVGFDPAGPDVADVEIDGTRVYATVESVTVDEQYDCVFTITTSSGAVLSRAGVIFGTTL